MQSRLRSSRGSRWASLLNPSWQRGLLLFILAAFLVAGLRPFNFFPRNRVTWLKQGAGVLVHGYGEILGASPLATRDRSAPPELTLELWMTSLDESSQLNDVLSIYSSGDREPFAIEQWGTRLLVAGLFLDAHGHRKFQRIGIENVFAPGAPRFITLSSSAEGTRIYLEGVLKSESPGLTLDGENFDGSVLLGQTAGGRQDWRGVIRGLAFYNKQLTPAEVLASHASWSHGDLDDLAKRAPQFALYPFDEGSGLVAHNRGNLGADLSIPRRLRPIAPVILELPSRRDFSNVSDVTLNIFGFVPFGFLLFVYLKRSRNWTIPLAVTISIGVGFLVSLLIELLQVFLPTRDSSLLDLVNNTLGTGIGAAAAAAIWSRLQRLRPQTLAIASAKIGWRWER